nr:immunoglobulin light chain junction region [Macaca mulatta]MOX09642.1 immunoglobulin light chain junction region [Macaca mulatta]
CIQALDFPLTF